jgi:uncharacterized OsmC-like protein
MTGLRHLLVARRTARRRRLIATTREAAPRLVAARVRAEGGTGIRHIQIRDFQILTDLGPDCAGFDLGPTPFELQLGVLGSCLTQSFLLHAAASGVPIARIEVDVTGRIDPLAGTPECDQCASIPQDIRYTFCVDSPAPADEIARLYAAVEQSCPILNLLVHAQPIRGTILHEFGPAPEVVSPN